MDGADVERIEKMMIDFKDEIKNEFRHQLGMQMEMVQHKLDIVVEGHQMLSEKLDRVEKRLDNRIDCVVSKLDIVAAQGEATAAKLDIVAAQGEATAAKLDIVAAQGEATAAKLDAIAADLRAHRADTEAIRPFTG